MSKGANVPLPCRRLLAVLAWRGPRPDLDICALLLTAAGKVRSDADFIFYNQRAGSGVRHLGKTSTPDRDDTLRLDVDAVPANVDKVIIAASVDGGTAACVEGLHLLIQDADTGADILRFDVRDATNETALVLAEVYRRDSQWKLRAVGQGYASGMAGLATDFGIHVTIDEPMPAPATAPSATSPVPLPVPASPKMPPVPSGTDWLRPPVPAGYELP